MAAMPQRVKAMEETIPTIIHQCDKLNIYLNLWGKIPSFLCHPRINLYRSQDHLGDLGDVGKFYKCDSWKGYIFTVDDKIVYPPDYAKKMIESIEKYKRRAVISCHGRIFFDNRPCRSYYFDVKAPYYCVHSLHKDTFVHELGTGVMAFHSDLIKPSLQMFPTMNMTDIWFSVELQKRKIPILCRAHKKGWIKVSLKHDDNYSIHMMCNTRDKYQTSIINKNKWIINKVKI